MMPKTSGRRGGDFVSQEEEVDLIVVHDHKLAEQIVAALKQAGIQHVDRWPEHMLRERLDVRLTPLGGVVHEYSKRKNLGPFYIRVRAEDAHEANVVLLNSGLAAS
jgi:hypothetical protein